jgi:RNA polymerase sigma-70 factor (ECF subfamily)
MRKKVLPMSSIPKMALTTTKTATLLSDLLDDELTAAIDQLPTKMREVFLLCDLDGNSYEETAELVGCPVGTVRSRLHRARHMLQETLLDYAKDKGFLN